MIARSIISRKRAPEASFQRIILVTIFRLTCFSRLVITIRIYFTSFLIVVLYLDMGDLLQLNIKGYNTGISKLRLSTGGDAIYRQYDTIKI